MGDGKYETNCGVFGPGWYDNPGKWWKESIPPGSISAKHLNVLVQVPVRHADATPIAFVKELSCLEKHRDRHGPTSCTRCPPGDGTLNHDGTTKFFTIVDPKTNTGTCTQKPCPFCKPKACCGPHHKHYVVNTESLEGVCVRHNNDCTALCMPRGNSDKDNAKPRVCTKGCNQLVKLPKESDDGFNMAVCKSDKRVVCSPANTNKTECTTKKWVEPTVLCDFDLDVWDIGATCISNLIYKARDGEPKVPDCGVFSNSTAVKLHKICTVVNATTGHDPMMCSSYAFMY